MEVIYKDDSQHVPYGTRPLDEIYGFTKPILESLLAEGCQVLLIACNTVTTNFASRLRQELLVPIVGMEPMVKPAAAATKTGVITVCATPRTLQSERYAFLKETYAKGITVLEPDCSDWSFMIENNAVDRRKIAEMVEKSCLQNSDQIVLGCTHYHWIEDIIREMAAGRAEVMQPEKPVIAQLKRVIENIDKEKAPLSGRG